MPSVTAKRKCPDLIFVKPRFDVSSAEIGEITALLLKPVLPPQRASDCWALRCHPLRKSTTFRPSSCAPEELINRATKRQGALIEREPLIEELKRRSARCLVRIATPTRIAAAGVRATHKLSPT
jgi:hypothetical protein